jgi:hypothetical protein
MPPRAAVQIAYEVRRGNPFTQYQLPDFELDKPPIIVEAEHVEITRRVGNLLVLEIHKPVFRVTVQGFDLHRDIRVKVSAVDRETGG